MNLTLLLTDKYDLKKNNKRKYVWKKIRFINNLKSKKHK